MRARLPIACKYRRDGLAKSRRHLECRSFKLERRTITPRSIVPRVEFVSSVGCFFIVAALQTAIGRVCRAASSSAYCKRLGAQVGLAVMFLFYGDVACYISTNVLIFAGGEDMGYFDCYSGGRGFESRRRRCS